MPTIVEMPVRVIVPDFPPDELLISEDGVPMESDWHRVEIGLLVELAGQHFSGRDDYFAGGNMFIYFNEEQARNKDFRGPDFFFVWGATPMPLRPHWTIWKEGGRYPNLIVELLSPSTAHIDRTTKKDVYEQIFRTPEYFCYDPDTRILDGWRLNPELYQPLTANDQGWLWSEQLKLWLGVWRGVYMNRDAVWLRLYTQEGALVPTASEWGKEQQRRAEEQQRHAEKQQRRAEEQQRHAEEERRRADALQAELDRMKAQQSPNGQ